MRLFFANRTDLIYHIVSDEKTVTKHIQQLVKNEQIVIAAAHFLGAKCPGLFRGFYVLSFVVRVPRKAVAHRVDLDAEFFEGLVLAVAVGRGFHELDHTALQSAPCGPHHNTYRSGRFPLAVTGVEHQQAFSVFAVVFTSPLVAFLGHLVGTTCGSGWFKMRSQIIYRAASYSIQPPSTAGGTDCRSLRKVPPQSPILFRPSHLQCRDPTRFYVPRRRIFRRLLRH